jgi:hypothetical protein
VPVIRVIRGRRLPPFGTIFLVDVADPEDGCRDSNMLTTLGLPVEHRQTSHLESHTTIQCPYNPNHLHYLTRKERAVSPLLSVAQLPPTGAHSAPSSTKESQPAPSNPNREKERKSPRNLSNVVPNLNLPFAPLAAQNDQPYPLSKGGGKVTYQSYIQPPVPLSSVLYSCVWIQHVPRTVRRRLLILVAGWMMVRVLL